MKGKFQCGKCLCLQGSRNWDHHECHRGSPWLLRPVSEGKPLLVPWEQNSSLWALKRCQAWYSLFCVLLFPTGARNYGIKSRAESKSKNYGVRQLVLVEDESQKLFTWKELGSRKPWILLLLSLSSFSCLSSGWILWSRGTRQEWNSSNPVYV